MPVAARPQNRVRGGGDPGIYASGANVRDDLADDEEDMAELTSEEAWALHEVAEAAREVPLEEQPERLQRALARLIPLQSPFSATEAGPAGPERSS
jgi:hypothetical protein